MVAEAKPINDPAEVEKLGAIFPQNLKEEYRLYLFGSQQPEKPSSWIKDRRDKREADSSIKDTNDDKDNDDNDNDGEDELADIDCLEFDFGKSEGNGEDIFDDDDGDDDEASSVVLFSEVNEEVSNSDVLNRFGRWLKSLDGGSKNNKLAQMHVSQVSSISKTTVGDEGKIINIAALGQVRDKWLDSFTTERRPGTVQSYLHSLLHFYKFLICEDVFGHSINQERLIKCINRVKFWIKSNRKKATLRKWEKQSEDACKLATDEDFRKFDSSEPVRRAIKIIASYTGSTRPIKKGEYTCARDYLLTSLCIDNASRTGAIANITMQEVERAERDGESMLISVLNHKTLETSGPAVLCLPLTTFGHLNIFIKQMRSQISIAKLETGSNVFLSWTGQPMTSSHVSEQLNVFWKSATSKPMNAALMRKSFVTKVHTERPDMKVKVASHMCHSVKTAENSYFIHQKRANSAETSNFLRGIMRREATCTITKPTEEDDDDKNTENKGETGSEKEMANSEEQEVRKVFAEWLDNEEPPPLDIVRQKLANTDITIKKARSIYDKMRYWIRQKKARPASPPKVCETTSQRLERFGLRKAEGCSKEDKDWEASDTSEESEGKTASSAAASRRPYKYSKEDNIKIKNVFKKWIQGNEPIYFDSIMETFNKNAECFQQLLKHLNSEQLVAKVRTLRREYRQGKE